jgi:hypothetical protein
MSEFADPIPMKMQRPMQSDNEHVVLQFRPRNLSRAPRRIAANANGALRRADDLSRYEQPREQPDDFRHRMLANAAAFAFTIALTAVGLWLAMNIADLSNMQDCTLLGVRDCALVSAPRD